MRRIRTTGDKAAYSISSKAYLPGFRRILRAHLRFKTDKDRLSDSREVSKHLHSARLECDFSR